jgi:hypothetical protein
MGGFSSPAFRMSKTSEFFGKYLCGSFQPLCLAQRPSIRNTVAALSSSNVVLNDFKCRVAHRRCTSSENSGEICDVAAVTVVASAAASAAAAAFGADEEYDELAVVAVSEEPPDTDTDLGLSWRRCLELACCEDDTVVAVVVVAFVFFNAVFVREAWFHL